MQHAVEAVGCPEDGSLRDNRRGVNSSREKPALTAANVSEVIDERIREWNKIHSGKSERLADFEGRSSE